LTVSFAMTIINKSQDQSLKHVGVYILQSIFSHGQLYVAMPKNYFKKNLKDIDNQWQRWKYLWN
jgi:hypothetical protein